MSRRDSGPRGARGPRHTPPSPPGGSASDRVLLGLDGGPLRWRRWSRDGGLNVLHPQVAPSRVAVEGSEPEPADEPGRRLRLPVGNDDPGSHRGAEGCGKPAAPATSAIPPGRAAATADRQRAGTPGPPTPTSVRAPHPRRRLRDVDPLSGALVSRHRHRTQPRNSPTPTNPGSRAASRAAPRS